jgi:Tol biopolymer transport system component
MIAFGAVILPEHAQPIRIYVMDNDGRNLRCLSTGMGDCMGPDWSDDGKYLRFAARMGSAYPGELADIWHVWDGESEHMYHLSEEDIVPDARFSFPLPVIPENLKADYISPYAPSARSPDSTYIAFVENGLWITDSEGLNLRQLHDMTPEETSFAWSPDSRSIAFVGPTPDYFDVCITHIDGSGTYHIASIDPHENLEIVDFTPPIGPSWSPDSTQLVYCTYEQGGEQIYRVNSDGTQRQHLAGHDPQFYLIYNLAWAPRETRS